MLSLGIIIGTALTSRMGWKYAMLAFILSAAVEVLDLAYGFQAERWLVNFSKSII